MKRTLVLEERELTTLADLVHEELWRIKPERGAYEKRSLVRLAIVLQEAAANRFERWAVISRGPRWLFKYLRHPIFPEGKPAKRPRPVVMISRHTQPPTPKHKPKRKRMLPAAAGLGLKPIAPPPE